MRPTLVSLVAIAALSALAAPDPVQDSKPAPADPLKLPGYKAYVKHCAPCHGDRGDGKGVASRFLAPSPRDFKREPFRLVSTANNAPSPKDLFETIATGIGGTAMIPFAWLGEEALWPIVEVVEAFRLQGVRMRFEEAQFTEAAIAAEIEKARPVIGPEEPPEPPDTYESAARGLIHYRATCASCHGVDGRGVMPETVPAGAKRERPRDLARGVLKQIPISKNLFARVRCGMPGTAMPATSPKILDDDAVWDLIHYLRTLIPAAAGPIASAVPRTLVATKLEGDVPDSPDDPRFSKARRAWVAFAPFQDAEPGPPGATVQALAGERVIVFRFVIPDPTADVPSPTSDVPPDGIAVRVTATPEPPVLPFPGQPPRLDRAAFLTGPLWDGRLPAQSPLPRFENPEGVCRMVFPPDRAGSGYHRDGSWNVVLAVRTEEAGSPLGERPLSVSFAPFDGSLRRGPMPVGFSSWCRLVVR
jgi:mono/diheme cytochrome c family protein